MKWPGTDRLLTLAVIVLLVAAAGFGLSMCQSREVAKNAAANETLASGRTAASADASDIRDRADERRESVNITVKATVDEIRKADNPADRDRAAIIGLCRIDAGSSPECGVLLANP